MSIHKVFGLKAGWLLLLSAVLVAVPAAADAQEIPAEDPPSQTESDKAPEVEEADGEAAAESEGASEGAADDATDPETSIEEADAEDADAEAEAEASEAEEAEEEPVDEDNPGQPSLDRALEVKIGAESLSDLNEVVDLLDAALEKGLDSDNADFAEQVLVATLIQRASSLSAAVLANRGADPRRDPRWFQIRLYALTDLQRAVALDRTQTEAWLLMGRLQTLPGGNPSEARRALSQAIRLAEEGATDPAVGPMPPEKLSQVYALRGATQKAPEDRLADFSKAIELEPDKIEYRLLRARQHQTGGDADACLEDIDHALSIDPENAAVHELRALAMLMQERYDEALESFDRASELAPEAVTPYQYRSQLYRQQGKTAEAIAELDKAIEIAPGNLLAILARAELLMNDDQHERALADVDAALRLEQNNLALHLMRARLLDLLGRSDEALALVKRLADAAPDQPQVQLQLAAYYANKEMPLEAIPTLDHVLELDTDNPVALSLRGNMFLLIGKHAEAIVDFSAALAREPEDSGVLNNYAWTLATSPVDELRDGERAIELAEQACEITEYEDPVMLSTLAAAYAEMDDFETAIRWSEEALAKATESGTLDRFDGQLTAELESYREGKPWRELQDVTKPEPDDTPADEPVEGTEGAAISETQALPPTRSSDF